MTENLAAVRAAYDAFATGDIEAFLGALAPDFTSTQSEAVPWRGTYRGRDAVRRMFEEVGRHATAGFDAQEFIDGGDRIVVVGTALLTPSGESTAHAVRELHVWGVRSGTLRSLDVFLNAPAPLLAALAGD